MQFSTTVRNALLDAIETAMGTSVKLQQFTGSMPANCAAASTGTKLVEYSLASDWASAASGGVKSLSSLPLSTTAIATGTTGYYRFVDSTGTTCHEQGTVGQPWSALTVITTGLQRSNNSLLYVCTTGGTTEASGGPTGTGTGITDGTVVWDYLAPTDMTVDNSVLAVGQTVQITAFSKTAPGA